MARADDYQTLGNGRFHWQAYDPAVKTDCMSSALHAGGAWYFIDPIPLAPAALDEMVGDSPRPGAILLTNANHERAAANLHDRFGLPVVAHPAAAANISLTVDRLIADGDEIPGPFRVIELAGAGLGEVAYFHAESATLWVGDAVIHAGSAGFAPLPAKYCQDPKALRASLPRLLEYPFEHLVFAHGTPMLGGAHARLAALLDALS